MDSKVKKLAAFGATSVVLLVVLLVLLLNGGGAKPAAKPQEAPAVSGNDQSFLIYQNGQIGDDLSAFMEDEAFFDNYQNDYIDSLLEQNRLSLIITSVEKDLRIQIVDKDNKPVTGESFFVSLEGVGEYKDLDKDGVIYIGDLASGEYNVTLKAIEGYRVPSAGTRVQVKDKVEYLVINDISLLMKTEADIDAAAEDSAQEISDKDRTEIKKAQAVTGSSTLGIDVSKWQGEIDWDKVKNAGIDFVIIRCGYRGSVTGSLVEDPYFLQNIRGATSSGLKVGVYFFTQALNEVEAVEEASMVVSLLGNYELQYPVFIDTEGAGGEGRADNLDAETRTTVCEAFCRTIENAGFEAGVYASRNWYNNNLNTSELEDYVIWLAEYRSAPLYQGYYRMWQYTSKGKVDGIEGNVDMNISYMGY